jgi:signal recognition particle subunit SRP54
MVLAELGSQIASALQKMTNSTVIDQQVVDQLLKEICGALIASDVNIKLIAQLRTNIRKNINLEEMASGINRRRAVQKAVTEEIMHLLDSNKKARPLKKGVPNVIMFVGKFCAKKKIPNKIEKKYQEKSY